MLSSSNGFELSLTSEQNDHFLFAVLYLRTDCHHNSTPLNPTIIGGYSDKVGTVTSEHYMLPLHASSVRPDTSLTTEVTSFPLCILTLPLSIFFSFIS